MGGWTDGWVDAWVDAWVDRQIDAIPMLQCILKFVFVSLGCTYR